MNAEVLAVNKRILANVKTAKKYQISTKRYQKLRHLPVCVIKAVLKLDLPMDIGPSNLGQVSQSTVALIEYIYVFQLPRLSLLFSVTVRRLELSKTFV